MMASTVVAYILWFFFGWAGLHHVYLDRLNHAIVWFATLAGGCGIGWVRDIWKIPEYVEWCNGDKSVQAKYLRRVLRNPRAGCSYFRFAGMFVMGFLTSTVLSALVPDFNGKLETDPVTYYFLRYTFVGLLTLGNALGVYLVANIGELQCDKYYPFMASLCFTPCLLGTSPNMGLTTFLTVLVTWYKGLRWRQPGLKPAKTMKFCKNLAFYLVACATWASVFTAGIYFNATITVEGEKKIPVHEAVNNFLKSDAWKQTKSSLYNLFNIYRHAGAGRAWSDAKGLFDFSGAVNAYRVLGLSRDASQDEISKRCRKLSAEHHPDRYRTQTEKDVAQEKFIEIQRACSSLSSVQKSRYKKMSEDD